MVAAFSLLRFRAYFSAKASISRQRLSMPPELSSGRVSAAGRMTQRSTFSLRRWVAISK